MGVPFAHLASLYYSVRHCIVLISGKNVIYIFYGAIKKKDKNIFLNSLPVDYVKLVIMMRVPIKRVVSPMFEHNVWKYDILEYTLNTEFLDAVGIPQKN